MWSRITLFCESVKNQWLTGVSGLDLLKKKLRSILGLKSGILLQKFTAQIAEISNWSEIQTRLQSGSAVCIGHLWLGCNRNQTYNVVQMVELSLVLQQHWITYLINSFITICHGKLLIVLKQYKRRKRWSICSRMIHSICEFPVSDISEYLLKIFFDTHARACKN